MIWKRGAKTYDDERAHYRKSWWKCKIGRAGYTAQYTYTPLEPAAVNLILKVHTAQWDISKAGIAIFCFLLQFFTMAAGFNTNQIKSLVPDIAISKSFFLVWYNFTTFTKYDNIHDGA